MIVVRHNPSQQEIEALADFVASGAELGSIMFRNTSPAERVKIAPIVALFQAAKRSGAPTQLHLFIGSHHHSLHELSLQEDWRRYRKGNLGCIPHSRIPHYCALSLYCFAMRYPVGSNCLKPYGAKAVANSLRQNHVLVSLSLGTEHISNML